MKPKRRHVPQEFGHKDLRATRYLALYVTQAGWLVIGASLLANAFWPSTCTPEGALEVYRCSLRLPEQRGWIEAALLTWLWATPILVALEVSRQVQRLLDR